MLRCCLMTILLLLRVMRRMSGDWFWIGFVFWGGECGYGFSSGCVDD